MTCILNLVCCVLRGESAVRPASLFTSLGINDPGEAADGPGDPKILHALVLLGERNEDPVIEATRRTGRLAEIIDGVSAAAGLERRARKAAIEVAEVGKLTMRAGNPGDDAVNDWIAAMMGLYRTITGREPQTSVGAEDASNEGIAAGPLIRFLKSAAKPIGLELSEDALRTARPRDRAPVRGLRENGAPLDRRPNRALGEGPRHAVGATEGPRTLRLDDGAIW